MAQRKQCAVLLRVLMSWQAGLRLHSRCAEHCKLGTMHV